MSDNVCVTFRKIWYRGNGINRFRVDAKYNDRQVGWEGDGVMDSHATFAKMLVQNVNQLMGDSYDSGLWSKVDDVEGCEWFVIPS